MGVKYIPQAARIFEPGFEDVDVDVEGFVPKLRGMTSLARNRSHEGATISRQARAQ